MKLTLIAIAALLSGCLAPNVFYIGQLSDHDQSLFREAADTEGVETIDWPAIGVWIVRYGTPLHKAGTTGPGVIFIRERFTIPCILDDAAASHDQFFYVVARHEIGHTKLKPHSSNPHSVMHSPSPCFPDD